MNEVGKMNEYGMQITDLLFKTGAVRVSPADRPFWYTSGKIGLYYINTHFLFGGEKKALEMLEFINEMLGDTVEGPGKILDRARSNYDSDEIYRLVVDSMVGYIDKNIGRDRIDYISGGERRDWFFSLLVADIIKKPHITLYKSGEHSMLHEGKSYVSRDIVGASVLHIADLINEASSYVNNWIPCIRKLNGRMKWSLVVVDRLQGGAETLAAENVEPHSLARIDRSLFTRAYETGVIGKEEYGMLLQYLDDPDGTMRSFLERNPQFIKDALNTDERTASLARKCIEKGYYQNVLKTENSTGKT